MRIVHDDKPEFDIGGGAAYDTNLVTKPGSSATRG
jgi:hypothetical protein